MARANNGGWDFVKEGGTYQYKEDWLICIVKVVQDRSDDRWYRFSLEIVPHPGFPDALPDGAKGFACESVKDLDGFYSGMPQFYDMNSSDRAFSRTELQAAVNTKGAINQ